MSIIILCYNSIIQGEQVAGIWKSLIERYGIVINFAYKTFRWDSEANAKAHVHCVIIGFSNRPSSKRKQIFDGESVLTVSHINPYLVDADDVLIGSRSKPLCDVPEMRSGGKPVEGGFFIFTDEEKDDFFHNLDCFVAAKIRFSFYSRRAFKKKADAGQNLTLLVCRILLASETCRYLSVIDSERCPARSFTNLDGIPDSSISVMPVSLRE